MQPLIAAEPPSHGNVEEKLEKHRKGSENVRDAAKLPQIVESRSACHFPRKRSVCEYLGLSINLSLLVGLKSFGRLGVKSFPYIVLKRSHGAES